MNLLQGDYYREHQSLGSRSHEAAQLLSQDQGLDLNKELIAKARELTPDDLLRMTRAYLNWDEAYLLRVTP